MCDLYFFFHVYCCQMLRLNAASTVATQHTPAPGTRAHRSSTSITISSTSITASIPASITSITTAAKQQRGRCIKEQNGVRTHVSYVNRSRIGCAHTRADMSSAELLLKLEFRRRHFATFRLQLLLTSTRV